ncbi:MAG: M14 family metallopeptidase [Flavobacteriaceae bacterium]|nr:M14 family metallopeptidase [Flavobacteriaceae bacterium]
MSIKEKFTDRYLDPYKLNLFLKGLRNLNDLLIIGNSEENRPIYGIKIGNGPIKVLLWSQMHGNETSTTKALCQLLELLENPAHEGLMTNLTFKIIPQLNPDGAVKYTRYNANNIDLNRDAVNLTQSESKALSKIFKEFKPDFCFNLHDQRTLYAAGKMGLPATISFLAPSGDPEGSISSSREVSMKIIAAINKSLQIDLPGQIGRYDDSFNINCVGDKFSSLAIPTILFEAGHFPNDYNRNVTANYVLKALIDAIKIISNKDYNNYTIDQYLNIPENSKDYSDLLITGVSIVDQGKVYQNQELVVNYKEVLSNSKVEFIPYMIDYSNSWTGLTHKTIEIESMEINNKIVFDKQKPLSQIQSLINY